jgi:hypothetical protein
MKTLAFLPTVEQASQLTIVQEKMKAQVAAMG